MKYIANCKDFTVVMKPTKKVVLNGEVVVKKGNVIRFINGIYETSDAEEQKFIESLPHFNRYRDGVLILRVDEDKKQKSKEPIQS